MGRYRLRPGRFIISLIILAGVSGLIAWGMWSALAWAKGMALQRLLEVKFLARDEITRTRPVDGLIIRQEELIKAPVGGKLRLLVHDGERLRVGAPLAEIRGVSAKTVWSPRAGVFCTHLDGLEKLLVPGMIGALDMDEVEKININAETPGNEVTGGEIIGKVVDNLHPVLVYIQVDDLDKFVARSFQKGAVAHLTGEGRDLQGKIVEVWPKGSGVRMFIEVEKYPPAFIHQRRIRMELVTRRLSGWLVPEKAIVFKDGRPGIYVVSKQIIRFLPVFVQDRLDGMVLINADDLNETIRYVSNPGWAREGAQLDF